MARRKGELSSSPIDRGWPHQVAIAAEAVRGAQYEPTHDRAAFPSLCRKGHTLRRDDRDYAVLCFSDRADAERFLARFGGELSDPTDRPRR